MDVSVESVCVVVVEEVLSGLPVPLESLHALNANRIEAADDFL